MAFNRRLSKYPSTSIDTDQLLTVCKRISDKLGELDKSIRSAQLRLVTLNYIRGHQHGFELATQRFSDELVRVSNLSRAFIQLLDELRVKTTSIMVSTQSQSPLNNTASKTTTQIVATNTIHYQIASQQLIYYTNEWRDNIRPKIADAFALASRDQSLLVTVREQDVDVTARRESRTHIQGQTNDRIRDSLLRLRASVVENEQLVTSIATNLDYTRDTIDTLYSSLHSSRAGLDSSRANIIEAMKEAQPSAWTYYGRIFCCTLITVVIVTFLLYSLLFRLFLG